MSELVHSPLAIRAEVGGTREPHSTNQAERLKSQHALVVVQLFPCFALLEEVVVEAKQRRLKHLVHLLEAEGLLLRALSPMSGLQMLCVASQARHLKASVHNRIFALFIYLW